MQSACPVFDTTFGGSAKYNQILGRDVDAFNNFDRFNTTDNRFDNRFDGRFNNFEGRFDNRFNTFDNNMWMNRFDSRFDNFNRFNTFDGRFDNRFDSRFNNFDRFNHFDNNMWMNRFDGRFDNFNRFNTFDGRFDNFNRFNTFDGRFDNRFDSRFNTFDNNMWMNRFNHFDNRFDNFNRFNNTFDNNMWMNRFNNFDGRFDNRFNTFDSRFNSFDNNMWMNRFNNTFDNQWLNRVHNTDRFNNFDLWMNRFNNFDMWLNRFNNFDQRANNCWWLNSFDWLKQVEAPATWLHSLRFRPSHFLEYYTLTHPVRFLDNSDRCEIFLCFDLRGFKQNEINCTLDTKTRCIMIEAKHDVNDTTEGHRVTRQFSRKFFLPECFQKLDLSKCGELRFFCREGFLYVHLPLPMLTKEELTMARELTNTRHFELNRNHTTLDNADWVNQCHFRPANGLEYYTLTHPLRFSNNWGHCELFYCFDLTCFRRDEIKCTLDRTNRCLVIEAEHQTTDENDKTHHVSRKFHRKVMLPKFLEKERLAKLNELRACFTEEGLLYVALPLTGFTHEELRNWNCENMVNNRFHDFNWTSPFFRNSSNVTTKFL